MAILNSQTSTGSYGTLLMERHDAATPFHCVRCNKDKKAKVVATWTQPDGTTGKVCNGCHGELIARDRAP